MEDLVRAKYPIVYVLTFEEERVQTALQQIARNLSRQFRTWSYPKGFSPDQYAVPDISAGRRLPPELEALAHIHAYHEPAVYHLKDFHVYMNDARVIRLLREMAAKLKDDSQTIVITSPVLRLPTELEKCVTVMDFPLPGDAEIAAVVDAAIAGSKTHKDLVCDYSQSEREQLIGSCMGLTLDEIESVLALSLVQKKRLDVDVILTQKQQIIRKSGLLEYYPSTVSFQNVGGMEYLKEWLKTRTDSFSDRARHFGLPVPKGVLILGVQGCGKSLVAKAIASHWNLPMLRLDVGRIFGSLVGQSEENIRMAIKVAESVAPCILWADEFEKGFAGSQGSGVSDSGTTMRVFATFLTWMQEKTSPVFIIATSNDVSALPPELLRKGRFDEIFFVDLPDSGERAEIFAIHLRIRGRDPSQFDLKRLAEATPQFSGAEIEQIVVGGLYRAFEAQREISMDDMLAEAKAVVPLSKMMSEEIEQVRNWAKNRTRPASRNDDRS